MLNEHDDSKFAATNGWEYADGTYEISCVASDNSGHSSGVSSRSFDIDNTAPFFIIQNPGVTIKSGKTASPYGSNFSVTGTIADLHEVSRMSLEVFNDAGTKLTNNESEDKAVNIYETSVATAGGTSVTFADSSKSTDENGATPVEYSRYVNLYGADLTSTDTRNFKCSIFLSDAAKIYQNPGDSGVGLGNFTTKVYLYDDVYTDYLSSSKGLGLSAASLMQISNGTAADSIKTKLSKSDLEAKAIDTADFETMDNRLAFSLNPAANPTYVVSGFEVYTNVDGVDKTPEDNSIANNSAVTISVSAGLNKTAVNPDTVHVWIKNFGSEHKYTEAEASEFVSALSTAASYKRNLNNFGANMGRSSSSYDSSKTTEFKNYILEQLGTSEGAEDQDVFCVYDNTASNGSSNTNLTIGFNMPSYIKKGNYYVIAVTGCDQDGLEFGQATRYGFTGIGTGKLPTIEVTSPANLSLLATSKADNGSNNGLTFKGKAKIGDSELECIDVVITVKDEENSDASSYEISGQATLENKGSGNYEWEFSPEGKTGYAAAKCESGDNKAYLYEATFTVHDKEGQTTIVNDTVHIDTIKPKVTISALTPIVTDYDDKSNVNGIITVKGNVEETNLKNVRALLFVNGEQTDEANAKQTSGTPVKEFSFNYQFDTTNIINNTTDADAKEMIIVVKAEDLVGNVSESTSTIYNGNVTLTVNQLSDKPMIIPSNFSLRKAAANIGVTEKDESDNIKLMDNLFGKTSNNKITATISDDDGIDKITVWYKKNGATGDFTKYTEKTLSSTDASGKKTGPTSHSLNLTTDGIEEGIYDFKISVTDVDGNSNNNSCEVSTVIGVTYGAPHIEITKPSNGTYVQSGKTLTVEGKVSNYKNNSIDTLKSVIRSGDGTNTDRIGEEYENTNSEGNVTSRGKFFNEDVTTEAGDSGKEVELKYVATDIFNQTTEQTVKYILDNTPPEFKTYIDADHKFKIAGAEFDAEHWYAGEDLSIEGYYLEEHSGVQNVHYELTPHGYTSGEKPHGDFGVIKETIDGKNYYRFKGSISGFKKGTNNKLILTATDEVGNKSDESKKIIKMDDEAPVFAAKYLSVDNGESHTDAGGTVTVNGKQKVILYGTIEDKESGLDAAKLNFKLNGKDFDSAKKPVISYTTAELSIWEDFKNPAGGYLETAGNPSAITGWKAVFSASSIDNGTLSVEGLDQTGKNKFTNSSILSFTKDDKAPEFKISNAVNNVNGKKDISGTASENFMLSSMRLYYSTSNEGAFESYNYKGGEVTDGTITPETFGWKAVPVDSDASGDPVYEVTNISDIYSWSFKNFDFNINSKANLAADGKAKIYILPVIKDSAGNCSAYEMSLNEATDVTTYNWKLKEKSVEFSVDMNADRPVVQFTNISKNGTEYTLMYGTNATISGAISDDDSTSSESVKTFIAAEKEIVSVTESASSYTVTFKDGTTRTYTYSESGASPAAKKWISKITDSSETRVEHGTTLTGSDWTYTPEDTEDGNKEVYFYIKDNDGTEFFTRNTNVLYQPYAQFKSEAKADSSSPLTYKSDCTSPSVKSCMISTDEKTEASGVSCIVGGSNEPTVSFIIEGYDDNGIKGVSLEVEDEGKTNSVKINKWLSTADNLAGFEENGNLIIDSVDSKKSVWTTGEIDISGWSTGSANVTVNVYDGSGLKGNGSYTFSIDNAKPSIKLTSPNPSEEVTGAIKLVGTSSDEGSAGVVSIKYCIPETTEVEADYEWKDTLDSTASTTSWVFSFDGLSGITHCPSLTEFDDAKYCGTNIADGIYTIPVYIRAEDAQGNVKIEKFEIRHNPEGDRPKVEFSYPSVSDYDKDNSNVSKGYVTLGGTIRTSGSAVIPSGTTTVGSIYYQIGNEDGSDLGTAAAKTAATGKGYTVVSAYDVINEYLGAATYSQGATLSEADYKKYGFASAQAVKDWWGIKATGTAAWNFILNKDGELNPPHGEITKLTLRVCGVNAEGKFGAWSTGDNIVKLHIDDTAPTITSSVKQYANGSAPITGTPASDTEPTADKNYEADMYLKGNWTLVLEILDDDGVTAVGIQKDGTAITENTAWYKKEFSKTETVNGSEKTKTGYLVYIPIDKSSDKVEYTAVVSDSTHTASQSFSFKIDEIAPTLERDTEASYDITAETPEEIKDSNYIFTIGGKSTDTGAGVERVVVYFSRNIDGTGVTKYASDDTSKTNPLNAVIFDPMLSTGSKVPMTGLTVRKFTQGDSEYELYAKTYSGTATTDEFTTTGTYDSHVRVGGLVEIDGVLRKITKIDGKKVEFTPSLTQAKTTAFNAYFPIAQVIDNSAKEETKNNASNPFVFSKGDDGDLMPESFSKTGSVWTWDASVHSTNMSDGPVNIVILAFDKAGNVTGKTISTTIANNAPRIAKVYFGTDLSGDGKFVNSDSLQEIVEYNILAAEGKEQSAYELDFTAKDEKNRAKYANGIFTIKNGLAVIPELTGGNGDIAMVLNASATNTNKTTGSATAGTLISSSAAGVKSTTTDEETGAVDVSVSFTGDSVNGTFKGSDPSYGMQAFVIAKNKLGSDAASRGISFTFWDSTEETVQGTNSQYSVLFVKNFKVAQTDSTAPTVVVNPFWWNSLTDNSIYDSTNASKFTDLKGHIELEKDLVITKADGTTVDTALKTQLGADPKVSGKITVSGTAYDNTRLASLTVKFGSYKTAVAATYDATSSSWTVPATTLADDGYIFTVSDVQKDSKGNTKYYGNWEEDVYFGQKGHKVYWTLSLDTEKLLGTTAVAKDVSLSVTAKDAAGKTTAGTVTAATTDEEGKRLVTDGTTNVPTYQLDVVPYVVKVTTALSKKKKSNPSVANRTALGHYPVQTVVTNMSSAMNNNSSETVTLEGFNLNHATLSVTGGTSVSSTASSASEMSKILFNVVSLSSGKMTATVNSIPVINNLNNNDASGDAESAGTNNINWYNRNGNGDNNNTLTDDVIFDVWEFNDKAAVPFSGTVGGTKMKINQVSGQPNFAFTNGNLWWNMGGNVNVNGKPRGDFSSYYWSGGYDCLATVTVGFHVDEMGYTYGSGAGGDSNTSTPPAIDSYTMWVQRWGLGSQDARSTYGTSKGQVTNGAALEKVGQTEVVNGVTKYAMNKQRIQSPEFASAKNGNNTNLYHAYYDAMNDEIRFKAGTITGTKNGSSGQFVDQYCSQYGESSKTYNIDNVQVVASKSISGRGPGKYLGIAVAKAGTTDVVVMVWYDAYENQLLYSYKVNPIANLNSKDATAANWSAPKTIFDEGGEWCQIAVDAKNHIHIAAFAGDGDLKYAYLESYSTAKADIKTCTVDADGTVGEHLTLDVALDADGNSIPYIGYYSSTHKKPKYAYVVDTSVPAPAGVDEADMFTGAWEVTVVPCYSNMVVNQEEKINVGVWKYTADDGTNKKGQIKNSKTGTSSYYSATGNNLYNGTNWSKTYGNGTANGILAYQVQDGSGSCVETAQMR